MKRFMSLIVLFSALLLGITLSITTIKFSDAFIIDTKHYKIAWNLYNINTHPDKIKNSLVFLGSSMIQMGICDSLLIQRGLKSINLGTVHFSHDLNLYFLKRVLPLEPKAIIIQKKKA